MLPGLRSGDLLIVDKRAYRQAEPTRGDVVVVDNGEELLVKRVVGLPGEEVELRLGELYVNQAVYAEAYPVEPGTLSLRKGRLLNGRYALLGDNRSVSVASSVHAVVSKAQILGKVIGSLHLSWTRRDANPGQVAGNPSDLPLSSRNAWTAARPGPQSSLDQPCVRFETKALVLTRISRPRNLQCS